ncbi:hypothetical protein VM98_38010, partial [Streptomyces rubellomurinus subsp. indigoferus]
TGVDEIVETVVRLVPYRGGLNLDDHSAQRYFEPERLIQAALATQVIHDDNHDTSVDTPAARSSTLPPPKDGASRTTVSRISSTPVQASAIGTASTPPNCLNRMA